MSSPATGGVCATTVLLTEFVVTGATVVKPAAVWLTLAVFVTTVPAAPLPTSTLNEIVLETPGSRTPDVPALPVIGMVIVDPVTVPPAGVSEPATYVVFAGITSVTARPIVDLPLVSVFVTLML